MDIKKLFVVGIDHKELSMEEREAFIRTNPNRVIERYFTEGLIEGYVNLSTCLRVEFYFYGEPDVKELLEDLGGYRKLFVMSGEDALDYLFRVVCGFESVIKGEDQILAQTKKSYTRAFEEGKTNGPMNVIFNRAIEIGKKFRSVSRIGHNALSLEAISLRFIKEHVEDIRSKKVFILGTGDLSQGILYLLKKEGVEDITITNRSSHKAYEMQNIYDVGVAGFHEKNEKTAESQVIISATAAPHYILRYDELKESLHDGGEKVFLDLAVPRDIDERIGEIEGMNLYNLDHVWEVYERNVGKRSYKLKEYYYLLEEQKEIVRKWFYYKNKSEER